MVETICLIIMAAGIGFYQDINKPTQYELKMEDGTNTYVMLQKNNLYACPLYCAVDHSHYAVICNNNNQIALNKFVYHITEKKENVAAIYCSTKKILSMSRFIPHTAKDKHPDVVTASTEK